MKCICVFVAIFAVAVGAAVIKEFDDELVNQDFGTECSEEDSAKVKTYEELVDEITAEDLDHFACSQQRCKAKCQKKGKVGSCINNICVCKDKTLLELLDETTAEDVDPCTCDEKRCEASCQKEGMVGSCVGNLCVCEDCARN